MRLVTRLDASGAVRDRGHSSGRGPGRAPSQLPSRARPLGPVASRARVDEARWVPVVERQSPASRLRLYDALSYLASSQGRALVEDIGAEIKALAHRREHDPLPFLDPSGGGGARADLDPFRVQVLEHCYDDHYQLAPVRSMPVAVVRALAQVADQDGLIDPKVVGAKLGPYAAQVASRLEAALQTFERPALPLNTKYETADPALRELVARSMPRDYGAARMPLLSEISRALGDPTAFAGWKMASMGHLFATRPALYDVLDQNGLAREDHLVSGKGYSRTMDVVVSMKADGRAVDESLLDPQNNYEKGSSHEDARAKAVLTKLFEGVSPDSPQRFLLLDDGANLLVALHRHFPEHAKLCRVVEQTEHGLQRIEREIGAENLKCPVINMARSWLKKLFESPIIGEAVMHSVETSLREIHPELGYAKREAALLGFGAVNQAVAKAMERRGFSPSAIWVWDPDPAQRALALQRGYRVPDPEDQEAARREVLRHGFLTVTATGRQTLSLDEYALLPPSAIVANGGSGNHELGTHELDADQRRVAPLPGDRHYLRVGAPGLEGRAQVEALMKIALDRLAFEEAFDAAPSPRQASLLGYDEDAKVALQLLRAAGFQTADIVVTDRDPARQAQARRDGLRVDNRDEALRHGTIVVSNRENAVHAQEDLARLRPRAISVVHGPNPFPMGTEVAPGDEHRLDYLPELRDLPLPRGAQRFRGYVVNDAIGRAGEAYRHRVLHTGDGDEVLVLRSGYVINMETGIPPEYAQLILGMLQAGLLQATQTEKPGLHELAHQDFLLERFQRCLDKIGRSLQHPSFEGLRPAI